MAIGGSIIAFGFLTHQNDSIVVENITPYEKLQNYKEELKKINQYNEKILEDLEQKIADSDDINIKELQEEIKVLKLVISDNNAELEQIIQKLSEMESNP